MQMQRWTWDDERPGHEEQVWLRKFRLSIEEAIWALMEQPVKEAHKHFCGDFAKSRLCPWENGDYRRWYPHFLNWEERN